MIYSFDVFDTCLCRSCGDPDQVFVILARTILGEDASDTQVSDFRYLRKIAEYTARSKRNDKETTIKEIYDEMDFSYIDYFTKKDVLEAELRIEKEMLCPISSTLDTIQKIHNKGNSILFITDMYLPSYFIKDILQCYNFWAEGDQLFVSAEQRASKMKGTIFPLIKKKNRTKR